MIPSTPVHDAFVRYARELQERIVRGLAEVEPQPFDEKDWTRPEGGGGRMRRVRGDVIEKGAVLVSDVWGASNPLTGTPFRAAGLSLIVHPLSPHAPTVHLNVRHFHDATGGWWGGGLDLTPLGVHHPEDAERFHAVLRDALGDDYAKGKAEADRYFFVPHRNRPRGAGGVFYDHVRTTDAEADFAFIRRVGDCFLDAYLPLLRERARQPFSDGERDGQLRERGIYVEFNLLYDRGTRFGFQSGGNPEAILASLPPLVRW